MLLAFVIEAVDYMSVNFHYAHDTMRKAALLVLHTGEVGVLSLLDSELGLSFEELASSHVFWHIIDHQFEQIFEQLFRGLVFIARDVWYRI